VCAELEAAAPKVVEMVKEARRRRQEQEHIWEQQRKVEARKEAERRRNEAEEQRRKQLLTNMQNWQTAKNIRAYVGEVTKLIEESGLKAAKGGSVDDELTAALAYADELDPVSVWREEIQKALATFKSASTATSGTDERGVDPTQNEATDNESEEADPVR
jgi:ATP-dependent 26S proteasome regulatory subunit